MTVFVDSSFLIALFNKDDQFHQSARKISRQLETQQVVFTTSNIVLCETINFVFRTKGAKIASSFYALIKTAAIPIFNINNEVFKQALKLLFKQKTKRGLNFFDCLHLAVMNFLTIKTILTFDQDFQKTDIGILGINQNES